MYIHFKGQGRDVSINMDQVKEIQYNLVHTAVTYAIRLILQYPQEIAGSLTGMYHYDFYFNDEQEKNECRKRLMASLTVNASSIIILPEIKAT